MIVIGKDAEKAEKIILKSFTENTRISKGKLGSMYIVLPGTFDYFRSIIEDDEAFQKKIKEIQENAIKYETSICFDSKIGIINNTFSKVLGRTIQNYKTSPEIEENAEKCLFDKKFSEGHDDIVLEKEIHVVDYDTVKAIENDTYSEVKKRFLLNRIFRFNPENHKYASESIKKPCEVLGIALSFTDGRKHIYYSLKSVNFRKISYLITLLFY